MLFLMGLFASPLVFWGTLAFLWCISFYGLDSDRAWTGGLRLLSYLLIGGTIVLGFGGVPVAVGFLKAYWMLALGALIAYASIGVPWARFKWGNFCNKKIDEIQERVKEFGVEEAAKYYSSYSGGNLAEKSEILESNFRCLKPSVRKNKARITGWIMYWPSSVTWFMIHGWVDYAFNYIKSWFQGVADSKFDKAFENVNHLERLKAAEKAVIK